MLNSWVSNIPLFNPWLQNNLFRFEEEKFHKRIYYHGAKKYLEKELMVSLIGLRRTGKTTIIRQLINFLLSSNIDPKQIFFYEFDEENIHLEEIINFYFQNILKKDLYKSECYIFLDELQFIENWQIILKKYYDINPKIRFIVSGSTHLYLHKNTKESLAGRIININIRPIGWHEFLRFKHDKNYNFVKDIFSDDFITIVKKHADILMFQNDFKTFLSYGEFPYFFHENNSVELDKYFKDSILGKIFTKDISLFDVENRRAFSELFRILSFESAQEINIQNLARETGINAITVKRYIEIMEKMFLYGYIYKYTKSMRKQAKSFKKGYLSSLNLLRAALSINYWDIKNDHFGHIIETFVYNELLKNEIENIYFYHDTKLKKEVDFVITNGSKILPIEVKIKNRINDLNFKNIIGFMRKNNLQRGIMLYGGAEIEIKKIDNLKIECIPYIMI